MWVDAAVANAITRTNVALTEADCAAASAVIELYAGRTYEELDSISKRDQVWLRTATAWQAAFMQTPGYAERQAVASMSQDGLSMSHESTWQNVLAPLAARALKNLSWKGPKSQLIKPASETVPIVDFASEASDERTGWESL